MQKYKEYLISMGDLSNDLGKQKYSLTVVIKFAVNL